MEVYADGTLLWREDGRQGEGTAEFEHTETEDVPGLSIVHERTNQRADSVSASDFEVLFARATGNTCGWVVDWAERIDEDTDPAL
ncbi:hypothetical protein [Streptomyces phytophilus]|uniref:hypothetical protein n=1 Tax=Streptomyces phytophilus TaxID=722715 RepID=UPI0015F02B6E|nr:hypothetical protein [Streptomyces phytophilus]